MSDANNLRPSTKASMADSDKTATQSHEPSIHEKQGVVESVMPPVTGAALATEQIVGDEKNVAADTTSKRNSQASATDDEDDFVYPTKWKLTAITIALCLSVFCMALVSQIWIMIYLIISPC
jgi:hypothetical protein